MNSSTRATRFTLGLCSALLALALPVHANPGRDDADALAAQQISVHESEQWSRELAEQLVDDSDAIGRLTRLLALRMARQIEVGFDGARQGSEWQQAARQAVDAAIAEQHLGAIHTLVSMLDGADADPLLTARLLQALEVIDGDNLAIVLYRLRALTGSNDESGLDRLLQAGAAASHHDYHTATALALVVERSATVPPPNSLLELAETETGVRDPRVASAIPLLGTFMAFATPEFSLLAHCPDAAGQRRQNCLDIARTLSLQSSDAINRMVGARLWKQLAAGGSEAAIAEQTWRDMRWQHAAWAELSLSELEAQQRDDGNASTKQATYRSIQALLSGIDEPTRIRQRLLDAGVSLHAPAGWSPPQ